MNLKQYTVLCIVAVVTLLYFFVDSSPIPVATGALPAPTNRNPSVHREQAVDESIRRHNDMLARLSSGTATRLEWENYWCLLARENWKSAIELLGKYDGLPDPSRFSGFAAGLNPDDFEHVLQYSATKLPAVAFSRLSMECLHRAASKSGSEFLKLLLSVPDAASPNSIGILAAEYLEQHGRSGITIKDVLMMEPTPDRIEWTEQMLSAAFANHITANREQIRIRQTWPR